MPDKWKRRAILHINMLKKWHQPEAMYLWTVSVDPDEEDDVPTWRGEESGRSPSVGTQLTVQQKRQLLELLSDFKSVMSGRCGRTSIFLTSYLNYKRTTSTTVALPYATCVSKHS